MTWLSASEKASPAVVRVAVLVFGHLFFSGGLAAASCCFFSEQSRFSSVFSPRPLAGDRARRAAESLRVSSRAVGTRLCNCSP